MISITAVISVVQSLSPIRVSTLHYIRSSFCFKCMHKYSKRIYKYNIVYLTHLTHTGRLAECKRGEGWCERKDTESEIICWGTVCRGGFSVQFGKHGMNERDLCQKEDICIALEHSAKRNLAGQRLACGVHACTAVKGLQIRLTQCLWKGKMFICHCQCNRNEEEAKINGPHWLLIRKSKTLICHRHIVTSNPNKEEAKINAIKTRNGESKW